MKKKFFLLVLLSIIGFVTYVGYDIAEDYIVDAEPFIGQEEKEGIYSKNYGEELLYIPMGDSLAEGAHASSEDKRYINVLAALIEDEMGYDVTIDDSFGKSSTGLKDNGLVNLPEVIEINPDLITIEFGTNELNKELAAHSSLGEFKSNLTYLIKELKSKTDSEIFLVTSWRSKKISYLYDFLIEEIGEDFGVPVVNIHEVRNREDTAGPGGIETPFGVSDNWHPNDLGHQLIGEKIFEKAYQVLK